MTTATSQPISPTAEPAGPPWHLLPVGEAAERLGADTTHGLTEAEAATRLVRVGPNVVGERPPQPWWAYVRHELKEALTEEPLVPLLIVVGVLYALLGELEDAIAIFVVIVAVAAVEMVSEARAKNAVAALSRLSGPTAIVLRDGEAAQVASRHVVPGDLVLLEPGDRVAADLRLVEAVALRVDESSLTGESVPVSKDAAAVLWAETELGDRRTLAFAGTTVTAGKGRGVVVTTGAATEVGRIAGLVGMAREPKTPLQVHMKQLAGWLVWVALGFSVVVPVLGVLVAGRPWEEMLLTGLTLAFATIPEELPILVTMVLGLGAFRLARERAIVKRLRAAETLGSVSVIGTDKTGTLTENRMRVLEVRPAEGAAPGRLHEIGVLANDAQATRTDGQAAYVGDPTEVALLVAAQEAGVGAQSVREAVRVLEEYPFDDTRKRMSVVVERGGERWLLLKGAPESTLEACAGGDVAAAQADADAMAARGLRVLAFAERRLRPDEPLPGDPGALERDLAFVGLAGLEDPPRPEVPGAIATLARAGVRVLMLTGDHPSTARAIAAQVGIPAGTLLRGRDLDGLSASQLAEAARSTSVFARIAPEHKLRLVEALQASGEVVAVTGDGVNDGPALRQAQVGVAMGRGGTDVAREAADLVLADDNFATVVTAVRAGRRLYANLRKAVRYYLAAKVALVTASMAAVLAQLPVPFEPVQIIMLELFMDLGASTTFVAEPPEEDLMARPPHDSKRPFMDRSMQLGILLGGLSLAAAVIAPYLWTWQTTGDIAQAQTAAFVAWMVGHLVLAAHMRAERQPLLRSNPLTNRPFLLWVAAAVVLVVLGLTVPFLQDRLHLVPLTPSSWTVVLASALLIPSWWEVWKWARRRRSAQ